MTEEVECIEEVPDFEWQENDIRVIIPPRVVDVLGFDPKMVFYRDEEVSAHDLPRYNSGIMAAAHLFTRGNPRYMLYIGDALQELGIDETNMQTFLNECPNLDEIISCRPPQALLECVEGGDEIIALHLVNSQEELFLQDIVLQNPKGESIRRLPNQKLPGMGNRIFPEVMQNLESYARTNGFPRIGLYAAYTETVPVFESVGYSVDGRFPELIHLASLTGSQVPMVYELD